MPRPGARPRAGRALPAEARRIDRESALI